VQVYEHFRSDLIDAEQATRSAGLIVSDST
jgi:hypothetical protein